ELEAEHEPRPDREVEVGRDENAALGDVEREPGEELCVLAELEVDDPRGALARASLGGDERERRMRQARRALLGEARAVVGAEGLVGFVRAQADAPDRRLRDRHRSALAG